MTHTPERASLVVTHPQEAQRRSQAKQLAKRERKERFEYLRSLGLREQVKARIEDRAGEIVDRLMELAKSDDPQVSLRAIDALWNRSYGRPITPTVSVTTTGGDLAALQRGLEEIPPPDRLALVRESLGLDPPALTQGDANGQP